MLLGAARPRFECEMKQHIACVWETCASICWCGTFVFHDRVHCRLGYLSHNKVSVLLLGCVTRCGMYWEEEEYLRLSM